MAATQTMNMTANPGTRELVLTRMINAPPGKLFRARTEPDPVMQWFAPKPWTTAQAGWAFTEAGGLCPDQLATLAATL